MYYNHVVLNIAYHHLTFATTVRYVCKYTIRVRKDA